ncbi:hypothetical protein JTE90_016966 [Oedothorax gibbosus]|uniref:Uncharacterized protein n=1 Tax=Oedothorax gibbosus TaxID=931172 RepID=A0AAV6UHN1_9ARAC|nr:hypothetical protein JTE90_016966 [Oedothorax gibbosus]
MAIPFSKGRPKCINGAKPFEMLEDFDEKKARSDNVGVREIWSRCPDTSESTGQETGIGEGGGVPDFCSGPAVSQMTMTADHFGRK